MNADGGVAEINLNGSAITAAAHPHATSTRTSGTDSAVAYGVVGPGDRPVWGASSLDSFDPIAHMEKAGGRFQTVKHVNKNMVHMVSNCCMCRLSNGNEMLRLTFVWPAPPFPLRRGFQRGETRAHATSRAGRSPPRG